MNEEANRLLSGADLQTKLEFTPNWLIGDQPPNAADLANAPRNRMLTGADLIGK